MTAVTAVTDHTDHADHTGDDSPEDGTSDHGMSSHDTSDPGGASDQGRSENGRPEASRSETDSPEAFATEAADAEPAAEEAARAAPPESATKAQPEGKAGTETEAKAGTETETGDTERAQEAAFDAPRGGTHTRVKDDAGHTRVKTDDGGTRTESETAWDDGLIARRVSETAPGQDTHAPSLVLETKTAVQAPPLPLAYDAPLRSRLDALRELVGSSRTRLDSRTLAEASRVLDEATARRKLSGEHTVVAIAGATGSGKSQLFNALAGVAISETGVRRPTTAAPIACSWSDGAATLIDRLGIPGRLRRRPLQSPEAEAQLRGLVLVDLPDHDSAAVQHREQVDRILALVDAVIWVVDPEKYADAMLHERYLRPMAGHGEVTFVVLNQVDRLPGEAADQVLDDLRRLLDEDGIALGEYGEPGATVMALSALTGDGVLAQCDPVLVEQSSQIVEDLVGGLAGQPVHL
ncbi:GTPase, partial [Streptomyces mirabilis]